MLKKSKFLLWIVLFLLTFFFSVRNVSAQEYYFSDEFNEQRVANELDETKWAVHQNIPGTPLWERNGFLTFNPEQRSRHPYVVSQVNPIPQGNFSIEFKFQYWQIAPRGTGISLSTTAPQNNITEQAKDVDAAHFFAVWQGDGGMHLMFNGFCDINNCTTPEKIIYHKTDRDLNLHTIKLEYVSKVYKIYLDDQLIHTSGIINTKPNSLWMGNPTNQVTSAPWTKLRVDLIRVTDLGGASEKTPLILIPGIMGSELVMAEDTNWEQPDGHGGIYKRFYPKDEKVWVGNNAIAFINNDYFDILRLKDNDQTSLAKLLPVSLYPGIYQPTMSYLQSQGYELNKNFFIFPYDWRVDLLTTDDLLKQKVNQIKQQTGSTKVDILAHSMGGLLTKSYLQENSQDVRKYISLGSPYLGSSKLLKALMFGECFTLPILEVTKKIACIGIQPPEVKDIMQNLPSVYQLAPTKKYFDFYTGGSKYPKPFNDQRDIDNNSIKGELNYDQTKTLLTNLGYNTQLYNFAENLHTMNDNYSNTNGVDTTFIVGSGVNTIGQILEGYRINFAGIKVSKSEMVNINGDGTVPLFSASLEDPSRNLNVHGDSKVFYVHEKHDALPSNNNVLTFVNSILSDQFDGTSLPPGLSKNPYGFHGKQLSVHSPVNIHVYDEAGNHTGLNEDGDIEEEIPGSTYTAINDAKFIFLEEDKNYTIKLEATDQGSFDFKIREYKEDENIKTILYKDLPLTDSTVAETTLNTETLNNPPLINLDLENDGVVDKSIPATSNLIGDAAQDITPPTTIFNIKDEQNSKGWYKGNPTIELKGIDEDNGSGIKEVQYTIGDSEIQVYTTPFTVSDGIHKIKFKAIDKAGNEEAIQEIEIKVDTQSPEARIIYNLTTQQFDIQGIDDNLTTVNEDIPGIIKITDIANNIITLQISPKEKKRKDILEINTIQYNEQSAIEVKQNTNKLTLAVEKKSDVIKELKQLVKYDKNEYAMEYNPKKDITTLKINEKDKKKLNEKLPGIVLFKLQTDKGQLMISY